MSESDLRMKRRDSRAKSQAAEKKRNSTSSSRNIAEQNLEELKVNKGKKVAAGFKAGGASIKFGFGKVKGKFQ